MKLGLKGVSVSALFCDDIRREVNGKTSLIGCYNGDMLVDEFPFSMQKLCIFVRFSVSKDSEISGGITLAAAYEGDEKPRLVGEIPKEALLPLPQEEAEDFGGSSIASVVIVEMILSPVNLDGPTMVRLQVKSGESEIVRFGLAVRKKTPRDIDMMEDVSALANPVSE